MKFRPQNILAIISVSVMLYFTGLYAIVSLQSEYFIDIIKEKMDLLIELDDDTEEATIEDFIAVLDTMEAVKQGSLEFISREEALAEMENEFGEDFFLEGMENPFNDAIVFRLNAEFYTDTSLTMLEKKLEERTFVKSVSFRKNIFGPMRKNMNRLSRLVLILGILLILGALVLIHNTLKLSLNAQRKVIKTMELVGAKRGFILRPFLWNAFLKGFLSGLLAAIGICGSLYVLGYWLPVFQAFYTTDRTFIILAALVLAGVLIYLIVTYFTVKRYLKIQMEDIF